MDLSHWWNWEWAPTPDEWQALSSVLTLLTAVAGVVFALRQLRLARVADQRAAEAAASQARPYVSVRFDLRIQPSDNPARAGADGLVVVVVESTGATPAREISLTVTPPFQSSNHGRVAQDEPGPDPALQNLAYMFSGEPRIGMLASGQKLEYILDFTKKAVGPDTGLPKRYDVEATYWDAAREHCYTEPHILDLEPWSYSIAAPQPIDVIARQMRRVNRNLERK